MTATSFPTSCDERRKKGEKEARAFFEVAAQSAKTLPKIA
jgi:hypothetical protein